MGHAQAVAALWLAAFLAYSNSFGGTLVLDSNGIILEDSRVTAATGASGWYQLYEELAQTYRRLGDPDHAAIAILQGQIAAPWNRSSRPSWTT